MKCARSKKKSISEQNFPETFFVEHRSPNWNFMSLFVEHRFPNWNFMRIFSSSTAPRIEISWAFFVEHRSPNWNFMRLWNFMSLFRWAPLADLITTFRSFLKCANTCTCGALHLPRNLSLLRDRAIEWNRLLGDPWIFKGRCRDTCCFKTACF